MTSLLGEVALERRVWRCRDCGTERAALDQALGLQGVLSGGAAEAALRLLVEMPFRRAQDLLVRLCGVRVAAATIHRLTARSAGPAMEMLESDKERALAPVSPDRPSAPSQPASSQLIVRQADGVMVRFTDDWHEVKVGASYGLGPRAGKDGLRKRTVEPAYVALRAPGPELGRWLQAISLSQGLRRAPASQFISDAGSWMAALAHEEMGWSQWTLDYYHAAQQVGSALKELHGEGEERTEIQSKRLRKVLLKVDGNLRVRRSLQARMRSVGPEPQSAHRIQNVLKYLERHQEQTRYDRLRRKSWPMGSGCIEGGDCKLYIQQRFKRPGMRWSNEGFANLEALRRITFNQPDELSRILYSRN